MKVDGKEISLQKAVGRGVYGSIGPLKIEQAGSNLFVVSVVDPSAVIGKVRIVNFMRNGWALTDETDLPIASKPSSRDVPGARYGNTKTDFSDEATGWHGSLARYALGCWKRVVAAFDSFSRISGVTVVDHEPATEKR